MTNSQLHLKPKPGQLRYLRYLADVTGETFPPPRTRAQASAEIDRLLKRKRLAGAERRREKHETHRAEDEMSGDAAAVTDEELSGYGSTAAWA